jgi:hypothetical protein
MMIPSTDRRLYDMGWYDVWMDASCVQTIDTATYHGPDRRTSYRLARVADERTAEAILAIFS